MRQELEISNRLTPDGDPDGGTALAVGLMVKWQDGPLGSGVDSKEVNGTFIETLIVACQERLKFYQASRFACPENDAALKALGLALEALDARTASRTARGVEGTNAV